MTTRRIRLGLLATLALGAMLSAGGAVGASAASAGVDVDADVERWVVPQTQQGGEYWTPERMRAAAPGDVLVEDNVASSGSASAGAPDTIPAQAPSLAAQEVPVDHIGKVFFTLGGQDYVCSGNAISSANESTVATAGHCLNSGPGAFASQFTFVPAYENGAAPFGQWLAVELFAPTQWSSGGDITYDTGFAVVSSPSGATLSDTVGASGVAFNQGRGLGYTAFGYPAGAPFDGETLQSCTGTATPDPFGQSDSQGIPCNMTGGSSGGPWFIGGGSGGTQNSVNSFGYNDVPDTMFGPYWGSVIENTYASASS